jgi:hypothetical protein
LVSRLDKLAAPHDLAFAPTRYTYFLSLEDYFESDQSRHHGVVIDFDLSVAITPELREKLRSLEQKKPVQYFAISRHNDEESISDHIGTQWQYFRNQLNQTRTSSSRAYPRVTKSLSVQVRPGLGSPEALELETADLSAKGCFVVWKDPTRQMGDLIEIHLANLSLALKGRVAWVRDVAQGSSPPGIGVELYFRSFDEQSRYASLLG